LDKNQIVVLHREELYEWCYLSAEKLKKRSDYQFDPQWDWSEFPCNMALAYIANPEFKKYYTDCAIDFMTGNREHPMEMVSQMVFAEQRIISMCAKKMNIEIHHLLDDPFQPDNKIISHIWGAKNILINNPEQRKLFCTTIIKKIEKLFPEYYKKICKMECFKHYI
jgi:hypothetical protein